MRSRVEIFSALSPEKGAKSGVFVEKLRFFDKKSIFFAKKFGDIKKCSTFAPQSKDNGSLQCLNSSVG